MHGQYVQETKLVRTKAQEGDGYYLCYSRISVGIIVDKDSKDFVIKVKHINGSTVGIKSGVKSETTKMVRTYVNNGGWRKELRDAFGRTWAN